MCLLAKFKPHDEALLLAIDFSVMLHQLMFTDRRQANFLLAVEVFQFRFNFFPVREPRGLLNCNRIVVVRVFTIGNDLEFLPLRFLDFKGHVLRKLTIDREFK